MSKVTWAARNGAMSAIINCNKKQDGKVTTDFIDLDEDSLERDVTYSGGLLTSLKNVVVLSECQKACSENRTCILVVANVKLKRCFLQNEHHGEAIKRTGFVSVIVRRRKPKKPIMKFIDVDPKKLQINVAYLDGTISTIDDAEALSECVNACTKSKRCILVVANVKTNRCILRDEDHGKSIKKSGFVSVAVRSKKPDEKSNSKKDKPVSDFIDISLDKIEMDTIYSGGLISNLKEASLLSECKNACLETMECVRVVANVKSRRCFFRNKDSVKSENKKGFVSLDISVEKAEMEKDEMENEEKGGDERKKDEGDFIDLDEDSLERGVTYPKGTISVYDKLKLSQCKKKCASMDGCVLIVAFLEKKRCYLKNANHVDGIADKNAVSVNMESKDNKKTQYKDKSCQKFVDVKGAEQNTWYNGGLILTLENQKLLSDCVRVCSQKDDCVRVDAYVATKRCHLKNKMHGKAIKRQGTMSVVVEKKNREATDGKVTKVPFIDIGKSKIEMNTAYRGGLIRKVENAPAFSKCVQECTNTPGCIRVDSIPSMRQCFLKNKLHGCATKHVNWISYCLSRAQSDPNQPLDDDKSSFVDLDENQLERDVDYPGGGIFRVPGVKVMSQCHSACKKNKECVAFVAVPQFKRCVLKNKGHGKAQKKLGFISVSMNGTSPKPTVQRKSKINYCAEVVAKLDPKDRRSFIKQATCSR